MVITSQSPISIFCCAQRLSIFRELGITDTALAKRALQIMGGDVQAAIDLIYSGDDSRFQRF